MLAPTFQLLRSEDVAAGVRRVAADQISFALDRVDRPQPTPEDVHEYRRVCKRVRAALRMVRQADEGTYRRENAAFRDAARLISPLRSTSMMPATVDGLVEAGATDPDTVAVLHEYVTGAANAVHAEILHHRDELIEMMLQARDRFMEWSLPAGLLPTALGMEATYARGRRGLATADEEADDAAFHRWRKSVKYLQHQTELLSAAAPAVSDVALSLAMVSRGLGQHQDLADLASVVMATPYLYPSRHQQRDLLGDIRRRQTALRSEVRPIGSELYAAHPADFVDRMSKHWAAWRS